MPRFLIVDDEAVCRERLDAMLSPYGHCDMARSAEEALLRFREALDKTPYDLVCLDILMPGEDGHVVLAGIRELERQRQILGSDGVKVIMTTSLSDSKHCVRAFGEGCEAYVTKPVQLDHLRCEIESLIGQLETDQKGPKPGSEDGPARFARRQFLVVDDDRVCRELLRDMLSHLGDCDVAHDGQEAIEAVRLSLEDGGPYDLVFLDIMMPGTDGHDALQSIREVEGEYGVLGSDGVKVIMTTALNDSKHCIAAFREGCESYVAKPIVEEQLLDQMQALLGPLPPKAANRASHCEANEASASDQATAGGGRFLIVDDDPVCRELLRDLLRSRGACDVAYDGQEAIEAVRLSLEDGRPYDLVFLDIMMPGTDGHDALRSIRQVEEEFGRLGSDGVKVIMTTALSESKHCIAAFKEGCESYITKPIREDELFRAMDELGVLTCANS